jgi:hypothetical protein
LPAPGNEALMFHCTMRPAAGVTSGLIFGDFGRQRVYRRKKALAPDCAFQRDGFADSLRCNGLFAVQPKEGEKLRMSVLGSNAPARAYERHHRGLWIKSVGQAKLLERLQTRVDILRGSSGAACGQDQKCKGS